MLRLLNIEPLGYSADARAILEKFMVVDEVPLSRAELLHRIGGYDILITRLGHHIDAEVIGRAARLRAVVSATTGLDHIDLIAAEQRGVAVLSLRGEYDFLRGISATAELTWGLILALSRKIPLAFASVCDGRWERDLFWGRELKDRTLGIVGLGRLGSQVAVYARAFGMRTIAFSWDYSMSPPKVERMASLDELLGEAEIVSVHVPLNDETELMFGPREFSLMRPGAILVNTSRGRILDEAALLDALVSGHLGGAALDVVCDERNFPSAVCGQLIEFAKTTDRLLLTPHIGGVTGESLSKVEVFMANKLLNFLRSSGSVGT